MPLNPQARAYIEARSASGAPPLMQLSPDEARAASAAASGPKVEVHRVEDRLVPGPAGSGHEVPVRIYWPSADRGLPVLAWFHGGGWVRGSVEGSDPTCRLLANEAGAIVMSVEYRLAPEHRFPSAAEDCYAATAWLSEHADELGGDAARLAISGGSAGGNMAAVVALMAHDRGTPAIAYQLLVYPITDHDFERPSYRDNAEGYNLTRENMMWFWDQYAGPEGSNGSADRDDPHLSPLQAAGLAGLPPAHVITAEYDPLRDEGEAYAERMRDAGVAVTSQRYDGQIHGFFNQFGTIDDGRSAIEDSARRIREQLA